MASETPNTTDKPSRRRSFFKGAVDIVSILLVVTVAKTAVAEPFYVPSGSMEPTLMIGDELLATKFAYGYSTASLPSFINLPQSERLFGALPKRGDVVVFRWPGDRSQVWVKRVIALPGDHVRLERGIVFINGEAATLTPNGTGRAENEDGSQAPAARYTETLPDGRKHVVFKLTSFNPLDNMPDTVVPAGHVFVMGDNRDNSADSRVPLEAGGVGMLPTADLIGRVDAIVGSWDLGLKNQPVWTWPKGLRLSRFFSGVE